MKILNKHIHVRIASGVARGAIFFSVITSLIWFYIAYHQEVKLSQHQINQLITTVKENTAIALYLDNQELAKQVIEGLNSHTLISGVQIQTSSNQIIAQSRLPVGYSEQKPLQFTIQHPFQSDETTGKLVIYPNQSEIEKLAISHAKAQVILLIIYAISMALLTLLIVNKILTKPLRKIAKSLHAITPGEKKRVHLPFLHHENEIGHLVTDINALLDAVNQQIDKERELRTETENLSQKFRLIFERASAGIGLLDTKNQLVVANPALLKLLGQTFILDTSDFKSASFIDYFLDPKSIAEFIEDFWIKPGNQFCAVDVQLKHKSDTNDRWVHCLFSKVENLSNPDNNLLEVVVYDITERAEREQHIIYESEHDPLTLLLNRRASMVKLENLFLETDQKKRHLALLMIDLDGFKYVNDTYGHEAGDKVIIEVARRIKQFFRGSDVVARWGGDEFLIAFSFSPTYQDAVNDITTDLQQQIALPIEINYNQKANVGSSIGISLFPEHDSNISGLIEKADESMYVVKNSGKNNFHFYQKAQVPRILPAP